MSIKDTATSTLRVCQFRHLGTGKTRCRRTGSESSPYFPKSEIRTGYSRASPCPFCLVFLAEQNYDMSLARRLAFGRSYSVDSGSRE